MTPPESWPAGIDYDEAKAVVHRALVGNDRIEPTTKPWFTSPPLSECVLTAIASLIANAVEAADWRQDVEEVRGHYPEDIFLPDSDSLDAKSARVARLTCTLIVAAHEARKAGR